MSSAKLSLREEIRTENMWRLMAKLAPVAVLAMSINSINTFVDALFIGQFLGEKALAAVSLAFPLAFLTNSFAAMLGVGGSSLLSIAIGANDEKTQRKIFGTIVLLSIIVAIPLTAFGWFFAKDMIAAIGGEGEVLELGTIYYQTLVLGAFFQIFAVSVVMLIRAEGKIKEAMNYGIIITIVNMILNPIFIGYFEMGVAGAAYASILAMMLYAAIDVWYFATKRASYQVDLTWFKLEEKLTKPIISVGVSAMMLQLMFVVQQIVVFKMIEKYGDDWDIAFMGACYRIMFLMLVPGFGFSTAMQPVAGINYGAGDYARVKKSFWVFTIGSTVLTTVLMIVVELFPTQILGLMLPDATFSEADILNIRIFMSPGFMFSMFFMGIILFQSIGDAKTAGIVMVLREIVFFIPIVIILPIWLGIMGIYATSIIQNIITLSIVIYLVRKVFNKWNLESQKSP